MQNPSGPSGSSPPPPNTPSEPDQVRLPIAGPDADGQEAFSSPAAETASQLHPGDSGDSPASADTVPVTHLGQQAVNQAGGAPKPRSSFLQGRPQGHQPDLPHSVYRQSTQVQQWSRLLGWFSLGLGAAQLLAPRKVARAAGAPACSAGLVRAIGAREVSSGLGLLSQPASTPWVWSRVAGDAMDLALLGAAARHPRAQRRHLALAAVAVAGIAAVDIWAGMQSRRHARQSVEASTPKGVVSVDKTITINRTPDECYRFWRDFENLPRFMQHLESIEVLSDTRSRWRAKAPAGASVEWESELTVDRPGELLAWHSLPDADIDNAGTVSFKRAAGGRGTVVRVSLEYKPPGGKPAALLAKLFGEEPAQQVADELRHFKQLIETGEITTTIGQSAGERSPMARLLRKGEPG